MNRAADWLRQAERDLKVAEIGAAAGYHEWAVFAAQQCGEKAVKALVQSFHGAVRGQAIAEILHLLPSSVVVPEGALEAARELDRVYFTSGYPNTVSSGSPADFFSQSSSERYLDYARTVLKFCRGQIH